MKIWWAPCNVVQMDAFLLLTLFGIEWFLPCYARQTTGSTTSANLVLASFTDYIFGCHGISCVSGFRCASAQSRYDSKKNFLMHYNEYVCTIMNAMAHQITGVSIVYSVCSSADQGNLIALRHWPLWGEFTGDRWIARTKGRQCVKCFHLMASSW